MANEKNYMIFEKGQELKRLYKYLTGNLKKTPAIDADSILGKFNTLIDGGTGTNVLKLPIKEMYIGKVARLLDDYFKAYADYNSQKIYRTNQIDINSIVDAAEREQLKTKPSSTPEEIATAAVTAIDLPGSNTVKTYSGSKSIPSNVAGIVKITTAELALPPEIVEQLKD